MAASRREIMKSGATATLAAAITGTSGIASGSSTGRAIVIPTRDGLRLSGAIHGDEGRPTIVLIHGLNQSRLSWQAQLPLAERFRLVTYDLRGHGDSDRPADRARYDRDAFWGDDVADVLAATRTRTAVIVAWSMGGYVLGQYLTRHGHAAVAGANLVGAVTTFAPQFRSATSDRLGGLLASPDLGVRSAALSEFFRSTFHRSPPASTTDPLLVVNGMPPRELHEALGSLSTTGLDAAWREAPPMLVSHGAKDTLVNPSMAGRMASLSPRSTLSIFPDAGHSPFLEDPTRFNAELAAYADAAFARNPT